MEEKSFMIYECGLTSLPPTAHITEAELKRRIVEICVLVWENIYSDYPENIDEKVFDEEVLSILLHGTKESRKEDKMKKMTVEKFDKLTSKDFQNGAVQDEIRQILKEAEAKQPTRAEYKFWAKGVAKVIKELCSYESEVVDALMEMPGIPPED